MLLEKKFAEKKINSKQKYNLSINQKYIITKEIDVRTV